MKIGNRSIGPNEPPLIIAEIGINHGGSLDVAKSMVDLIVHSGCECVKHQTHIIEDEMTEEAKEIFPPNANKSIWDVMKECSLKLDEEQELKEYAENLGLIWISTPFSRMAADFLDEIDVPAFKIGSGEADNLPLINHIAQKGKPIIMSTGMQSIKSLENSVNILEKSGVEYALLECTNLYPSPPEIVSLQGIQELKEAFPKTLVGFSDHSIGPYIALASVALGACIIERHFTDTRYRGGPDITCSMDPAELRLLVDRSVEIHKALMNPKQRTEPEEDVYKFARASVVADRDMAAGHIITEKDIWVRRPGSGEIPGYKYNDIIGKKLRLDVKKNHQFKWSNFH
jgi:sialic acid synthase SpsE